MPRLVLHVDLDAFFCSVEEILQPELGGRPFAVGGRPEHRGVVSSASYPARKYGIRSAMPTAMARRLYRDLIIVPARYHTYREWSDKVMRRLRDFSPLVEQLSIDEAFLDISGMEVSAADLARRLQAEFRDELRLPSSFGAANNKLVAKIACEVGKGAAPGEGPPYGLVVVPPGEEAAFLAPLPVGALWGVGPKTAARLAERGIKKIGDLAAYPADQLRRLFGASGDELHRHAQGIDERPVETRREAKSISVEITFPKDVSEPAALRRTLRELSDTVGARLRTDSLAGSTVKIKLRWPDYTTLTRQAGLPGPTDLDEEIYYAVLKLFQKAWRPGKRVRLLGVGISGLGPPVHQLSLFDAARQEARQLAQAVDGLREK